MGSDARPIFVCPVMNSLRNQFQLDYPLGDLPPHRFLLFAMEIAKAQGWTVVMLNEETLTLTVPTAFGEGHLRLSIVEGPARIRWGYADEHPASWSELNAAVQQLTLGIDQFRNRAEEAWMQEQERRFFPARFAVQGHTRSLTPSVTGDFSNPWDVFRPGPGYLITPLLIWLNVLIFLLMGFSGAGWMEPSGEALIRWGANFREGTLHGEPWRLWTCTVVHIGAVHLLMNMYALFFIGAMLEPYIGRWRMVLAYLLTGLAGSVFSLWWHPHGLSAGASGAIFGYYGLFLALLLTKAVGADVRRAMLGSVGIFVLYNLVAGMRDGVDNAAHIGGLLSGLLLGLAMLPGLRKEQGAEGAKK